LFPDGKLVVFRAESAEPTRVHPMQVLRCTPSGGARCTEVGRDSERRRFVGPYRIGRTPIIPEGRVCVAGRAEDNAGNIGVSVPLRLRVDYTLDGNPAAPTPATCRTAPEPSTP